MKLLLFFSIIILGQQSKAQLQIGNQWAIDNRLGETQVFSKKTMSLTVFEGMTPVPRELTFLNYKLEITKSLQPRQQTLEMLNTKNWKASDIQFKELSGKKIVEIHGSYQKNESSFEFIEWQIYIGNKYVNLQLENKVDDANAAHEVSYLNQLAEQIK